MTADEILQALEDTRPQRDKLAGIESHRDEIRGLRDDVFAEVVRAINKKLNSPKITDQVKAFVASLASGRVSIPAPLPPTPPPPPEPPPPTEIDVLEQRLAADVIANPDAPDAYLAYGDHLAGKGDPRGEMIGVGRELATHPGDLALRRRHAELEPLVLGKLASCTDLLTELEWHLGSVRRARVAYNVERFNGDVEPDVKIADAIDWLFDGPGRFLQHLTVGLVRHDDNNYGAVAAAIGRSPRALRSLFLGDFDRGDCELNWTDLQDLSPIWPMCQDLRDVTLRGGSMVLGAVSLPRVRSFSIITGGLGRATLEDIARATWPELVELSIELGARGTSDLTPISQLLAGERVPKLKKLGIKNTRDGDGVLRTLVDAKVLAQLEELDVSMSTVTGVGFATLEAYRDRFAHLHKLRLGGEDTEKRKLPGLAVAWEDRYGPAYE